VENVGKKGNQEKGETADQASVRIVRTRETKRGNGKLFRKNVWEWSWARQGGREEKGGG